MNYKEGDITKFNTIIHIVDNMPMDCYAKSYKYILKIEKENTNLKQALNEIKECLLTKIRENQKLIEMLEGTGSFRIGNAQSKIKDYQECLQIIDKVGGNE